LCPLVRKIVNFGRTSRGVILPKSWLKLFEDREGCSVEAVYVEVDGVLKISPVLKKDLTPTVEKRKGATDK